MSLEPCADDEPIEVDIVNECEIHGEYFALFDDVPCPACESNRRFDGMFRD